MTTKISQYISPIHMVLFRVIRFYLLSQKTKALLNVIDQPEIITNVYIERGKYTPLENVMRIGEVDNVGDLEKYGYKYFTVEKVST